MFVHIETTIVGPEARYCPDCKRVLFTLNPDGTFNLSGQAGVDFEGSGILDPDDPHDVELVEMVAVEATCLLRKCRLRRWLRAHCL